MLGGLILKWLTFTSIFGQPFYVFNCYDYKSTSYSLRWWWTTIEHECKKDYIHYLQVYYCKEDEVCLYQSLLFEVPFEEGVSNPAKADVTLAHFVKPETSTSNFLLSVTPWVCGTLNQVLLPLLSLAHLLFIFLYILVIL